MAIIIGDTNTDALATELKTFFTDSMPTSLDGVTGDLGDWLDANEEKLGDWLDAIMERLGNWVDYVSEELSDREADALGDWLDNLEEDLETFLDTGLESLDDLIDGTEAADEIRSGDGDDEVDAGGGNDAVHGDAGDDDLGGGSGNDRMYGGEGDDDLLGDLGKDVMVGGAGADTFDFNALKESLVGLRHDLVIFNRLEGDEIDLAGIDADRSLGGNQAFDWIGSKAFSGEEGQLRFSKGLLQGDVNGDHKTDFEIQVKGTLSFDDIIG